MGLGNANSPMICLQKRREKKCQGRITWVFMVIIFATDYCVSPSLLIVWQHPVMEFLFVEMVIRSRPCIDVQVAFGDASVVASVKRRNRKRRALYIIVSLRNGESLRTGIMIIWILSEREYRSVRCTFRGSVGNKRVRKTSENVPRVLHMDASS